MMFHQHKFTNTVCGLLIIFLLQLPLFLSFFVASSVSTANANDVFQNFKDINFTNITLLDIMARKAMKYLHDDLDRDDDGNVSLSEGAQFIDREDFESYNSNLPGFATDKDGRITEIEFWETWVTSEVHNWTVAQMVEWLSVDVDLPQYADNFKQYGIMGAAMPILLDPDFNVLKKFGIPSNAHKRKIQLRAMEIVIFGLPNPKSNLAKDILLSVSIALALSGMAYAFHVRRTAGLAVSAMQEKLIILQKEMTKLDEDYPWSKDPNTDELGEGTVATRETNSSQSSLSSDHNLQARLNEVLDELSDARIMLERAEERLNDQKWLPPERLISCLKTTYKVELKLHENKRSQAQKKVEQAKSQFLKMKKKTSIFTSVQLVHSHQVDNFDLEVQVAKDLLYEVQRESQEFKKRWSQLESLCQYNFFSSSVFRPKSTSRQYSKESASTVVKMKSASIFGSNGSIQRDQDADSNSVGGLQMKELPTNDSNDANHILSQQSCPMLTQTRPADANGLPTTPRLTDGRPKALSYRRPVPHLSEKDRFSERFRTVPRKNGSPLLVRPKIVEPIQTSSVAETNFVGDQVQQRKPSLEPSEITLLTDGHKSPSSRSLPDLIDDKTKLADSKRSTTRAATLEPDCEKAVKKRSFFGVRLKKMMKS